MGHVASRYVQLMCWSTQASDVYVWVQAVNADCPLVYTTVRSDAVTVDLKPPYTRPVYNTMFFTNVITQAATDTFGCVAHVPIG